MNLKKMTFPGSRVQKTLLVLIGLLFLLISLSELVVGPIGARVFGGVLMAGSLLFIYRAARLGVTVGPEGIVEHGMERTRKIAWSELGDVETVKARNGAGLPVRTAVARSVDGSVITLRSSSRFAADGIAPMVEEIRRRSR